VVQIGDSPGFNKLSDAFSELDSPRGTASSFSSFSSSSSPSSSVISSRFLSQISDSSPLIDKNLSEELVIFL